MASLPNPEKTLHVPPQGQKASKAMDVYNLSRETMKLMASVSNVNVWAASKIGGDPIFIGVSSMRKLTTTMPAVKAAFLTHKASDGGYIEDVILPARGIGAYQKILGWVRDTFNKGQVVPMQRVEHYAVPIYKQIRAIARDMGMGAHIKAMDRRIAAMTARRAA